MIAATLGKFLLQNASESVLGLVCSGKLQAFGSTLMDPASNRTVGYLQARDTLGAAADTAKVLAGFAAMATPATAPMGAAYGVGKTAFALFDTQRTAHRIEDAVESMSESVRRGERKLDQVGEKVRDTNALSRSNRALQILDIGINVAGFSAMDARLSEISGRVNGIDAGFREFQEMQLKLAFDELRTLARSLDEGWRMSGLAATNRWHDVAKNALHVQDQFETRSRDMLDRVDARYMLADALLDAVSFANGLRVAALAASDEVMAAEEAAADGARALDSLTGRLGLVDLVRPLLAEAKAEKGTQEWSLALAAANEAARPIERKVRQREANALTRAAPLASLQRRGIRPRDWMEEVRARTDTALLFLQESDGPMPQSVELHSA